MCKKFWKLSVFLIAFALMPDLTWAQFDQERFGKNRLQHQQFNWYLFSSNNFEVYYYDRGGDRARRAIEYLESEFQRLTQMMGYVAYSKPKIYIYNTPEQLLQSNLNLNKLEFSEDGQTNFNRLIAEVAYKGDLDLFKEDLIYATSKVIVQEMLFGSSVADAFQANLLTSFPDWYVDGISLYLAKGWSQEMDDYIRHFLKEDEDPKIFRVKGHESALLGQSIWNYMAERYGKRYLSSVLNLSRINRNEENSIANTIGVHFEAFIRDWKNYYLTVNKEVGTNFTEINASQAIAETSPRLEGAITDIKFSPDGLNLAYVLNNQGKYKVQIRNLSSGSEQTLFHGGTVHEDQDPNFLTPVIAWKDSANLAIASFKRGNSTLRLRAIDGSSQDKLFLRNIDQILSLDFNSTGTNMVISAISNGKTDVYTLSTRGSGRRLTNDVFNQLSPSFLNDSTIVFSTNYTDELDSLKGKIENLNQFTDFYNIFMVEVGDSIQFTKLTNTSSKNLRPRTVNSNTLLFLSDQSGITNLMKLDIGNRVSNQISGYGRSLETFDISSRMRKIAFSVRDGKGSFLVLKEYTGVDQFTPSTPRIQLEQAKSLNERMAARKRLEARQKIEEKPTDPPASMDEKIRVTPMDTTTRESTSLIEIGRLKFQNRGGVDTENYAFDTLPNPTLTEEQKSEQSGNNLLEAFRKQSFQKRVTGPRQMEPQFFTNHINSRMIVDPLRGFGFSLNGKMSDLLDNHSLSGGFTTSLDFRSGGDLFAEYEYLKNRLDYRLRFDRRSIQINEDDITFQKYVLSKIEAGVSYPFNVNARFTLAPFLASTQYFNLNPDSLIFGSQADQNRFNVTYAGGKAEFVYDRTEQIGLYAQAGLKGKVGFVHYQGLNHSSRSFSNIYADIRNYQRIHKNIILASKLYVGSFFGNNPQTYLVGGMDNWLFNQFHIPPTNRPEASPVRNPNGVENSNILFADFVDLRGYDYDEIRGNNVITFTTELRIPLFSYLTRGNIASNFIRNFQLVGFYDVGSAWNEEAPWRRVNDQNTEIIDTEGSPFQIRLNNFNNPWLQSYGAGLRTVLLNYYVKLDMARPIRNYQTENLRFYVTLGYNF